MNNALFAVLGISVAFLLVFKIWTDENYKSWKVVKKPVAIHEALVSGAIDSQQNLIGPKNNEISDGTPLAPCPSVPIVTVGDEGRLGNKMWEYSSVWTMSRILERPGYVPKTLLDALSEVFANLSLPTLDSIKHCNLQLGGPVAPKEFQSAAELRNIYQGKNIRLKNNMQLPILMFPFLRILNKEDFRIRPEILQEVEESIEKAGGKGRVRVGIHVRRTDYKKQLFDAYRITSPATKSYYTKAMKWYRENIPGPFIFLIVSDDVEWCEENLLDEDDVAIVSKSAGHDMALMASSNHTIIDYGTFGHWGAFLAGLKGGHTITLHVNKYVTSAAKDALKNWHLYDIEKPQMSTKKTN